MIFDSYAEYHNQVHYAECRYAECRYSELSFVVPNGIVHGCLGHVPQLEPWSEQ